MPVYEFVCEFCGNEDEKFFKVKENTIKCKICGKSMKKIISRSSFHLRGEGWTKK